MLVVGSLFTCISHILLWKDLSKMFRILSARSLFPPPIIDKIFKKNQKSFVDSPLAEYCHEFLKHYEKIHGKR